MCTLSHGGIFPYMQKCGNESCNSLSAFARCALMQNEVHVLLHHKDLLS